MTPLTGPDYWSAWQEGRAVGRSEVQGPLWRYLLTRLREVFK